MFNLTENNEPRKNSKNKKNYYRYFLKFFGQKLKIKNHKILMKYEIKKGAFYMIFIWNLEIHS